MKVCSIEVSVSGWSSPRIVEVRKNGSANELLFQVATCYPCPTCTARVETITSYCRKTKTDIKGKELRARHLYFIFHPNEDVMSMTNDQIATCLAKMLGISISYKPGTFKEYTVDDPKQEEVDLSDPSASQYMKLAEELQKSLSENTELARYAKNKQLVVALLIQNDKSVVTAVDRLLECHKAYTEEERNNFYNFGIGGPIARALQANLGKHNADLILYLAYETSDENLAHVTSLQIRKILREVGLWFD